MLLHFIFILLYHFVYINCKTIRYFLGLNFYLHFSREFNTDNLTTDRLRADIAKLNANIVSSCISQGIPIDNANVTHTLDNLCKLLTFKRYLSRFVSCFYFFSKHFFIFKLDQNQLFILNSILIQWKKK
jgi:hypothetical protein